MSELALSYILHELEQRYGSGWLGARIQNEGTSSGGVVDELERMGFTLSPRTKQRLADTATTAEMLARFALRSVRLDSQMGLLGWIRRDYPLLLRPDIPSPSEMLDQQCQGKRFVTVLTENRYQPIGRHAGAFEFLLHDLEHAHKFFADPFVFRGQVNFFRFLRSRLNQLNEWQEDPQFVRDLEYLMSDMNSHPVHMFKFLKAIVLTATLRKTQTSHADLNSFWRDSLADWPESVRLAAIRVNHPDIERPEDRLQIAAFFAKHEL